MNEIQEYIEELFIDEVGVSYHTQGISWQAIVRVLDREIDGHGLLEDYRDQLHPDSYAVIKRNMKPQKWFRV